MNATLQTIRKDEQGFTLVELAVVMIIIGLLIGGILKGQELITNARVTSTISQLEAMGGAYNGFRDKFNALPGDMSSATVRMTACADACQDGDGSGIIDHGVGEGPAAGEGVGFFGQLLAADFITGMDGTDDGTNAEFGVTNPTAPIGGGFTAGDARDSVVGFTAAEIRPGPHIVVTGTVADVATGTGILDPQQAANLDRRLDDGKPDTGVVVGQTSAANTDCRGAANDVYGGGTDEVCAVAYRL